MGDSTTMTVEFLRARLLSERSVSRSSRQRADELAERVVELEEQLEIVSLQKAKAEKATKDILAILENHGMSEVSEALDSSSDEDALPSESKDRNSSKKEEESSVNSDEIIRNDGEEISGPEIDSSPSSGRSLSWKSSKDSSYSHGKKNNMKFSTRRRGGFASPDSSSPKQRQARSCRQIRRREMRSATEVPKVESIIPEPQDTVASNRSEDFVDCSNNRHETLEEGSENQGKRVLLESLVSGSSEDERKRFTAGVNHGNHVGEKDMERALEEQAQLIGRFEAEENAQREWEEKFTESNSCIPDSFEPGNCSDVSEERDECQMQASYITGTVPSVGQESKSKVEIVDCPTNESPSKANGHDSPASEFAFPTCETQNEEHLESKSSPSPSSITRQFLNAKPSSTADKSFKAESSGSQKELALMPNETPDRVGGVLEALQRAKLSLKQRLNELPSPEGEPAARSIEPPSFPATRFPEKAEIPVGCAQLFRVPSDFQLRASTEMKLMDSNYLPHKHNASTAGDRFAAGPHARAPADSRFLSGPQVSGWSRFPDQKPSPDPYPYTGGDRVAARAYSAAGLPSSGSNPFYPDLVPQMPPNELNSRSLPGRATERRPPGRFSSYDDRGRPNMYQ